MALFDSIIKETRKKFGTGDQAERLLSILLSMIADQENGGFTGFLERFDEAGLGDLAASWINADANLPISYEQTESVFGEETLKEVSEESGLDYKTTVLATALMTPHIVDELTPTGEVPDEADLTATIDKYLTGTASADAVQPLHIVETAQADPGDETSTLKLVLPLILVAVLIAISYMFCT